MRASPDTIRAAILHPERHVRERALHYFTDSHSNDTEVTALAIAALERYGRASAFLFPCCDRWPRTEAALDWALREMQRPWEGTVNDQRVYVRGLSRLVASADVRMLAGRLAEVARTPGLTEEAREAVEERLLFARWNARACWAAIDRFCQENEHVRAVEEVNLGHAGRLVEAVSRFGPEQGERALTVLQAGPRGYPPGAYRWLAILMIDLAGRQRLQALVPLLVPLLGHSHALTAWSITALGRIGTPDVVQAVQAAFPGSDKAFRLDATELLERIHLDETVAALLALLPATRDSSEQLFLHQALLAQFSAEAIEPTRRFLLDQALTPDLRDLRCRLVAVCAVVGAHFPELEAWQEEARHDAEVEAEKVGELEALVHEAGGDLGLMLEKLKGQKRPAPGPRFATSARPSAQGKVGRNDPCPCGSGKKFKNCCLKSQR